MGKSIEALEQCLVYGNTEQQSIIQTLLDDLKFLKPNNSRNVISHKEIDNTEAFASKVKTTDNSELTPRITKALHTEEAALNKVEQAKEERILTKLDQAMAKIIAETNEARSKARGKVLDRAEKIIDGFLNVPMYPDKNEKHYLIQDSHQPHDPRAAEDHSAQQQCDPPCC